jgi:hypothetical protein
MVICPFSFALVGLAAAGICPCSGSFISTGFTKVITYFHLLFKTEIYVYCGMLQALLHFEYYWK